MQTKTSLTILLVLAALLALSIQPKPLLAFSSPIPRPTLDPAWVCQQLGNCPERSHRHAEKHEDKFYLFTFPGPSPTPTIDWLAVPYQYFPD